MIGFGSYGDMPPFHGWILAYNKTSLKLTGVFNVGPAAAEGGIAVGAGSVWMIVDKKGSMARIDPANGSIVDTVHLKPGSYNPVFSEGRIWVTRASGACARRSTTSA